MNSEELQGTTLRKTIRKRSDVLDSLRSNPAPKPELVERLDLSRSTVDRAVDSLHETGLIRRTGGQYHVTVHGRLLFGSYQEYVEATDALAKASPILETIPLDSSIDRSLLESGTVDLANPHAPENAITAAVEELQSAERLRVFSPIVKSNYTSVVHEEVVESGLDTDLVLEQGASDSLASLATVTDTVERLLDAESFSLYTTDAELPYMLYLMIGSTDTVGITVHDDGAIVGSVTANDPDAVAWGRERFDEAMMTAQKSDKSNLL